MDAEEKKQTKFEVMVTKAHRVWSGPGTGQDQSLDYSGQ